MEQEQGIYALDIFKEITQQELIYAIQKQQEAFEKTSNNFLGKIIKNKIIHKFIIEKTPDCIKRALISIIYKPSKYLKNKYIPSVGEKIWSLDFTKYVLENNPIIPFGFFEKEDWDEIKKFVKNKFLLSIHDGINKNKLFDKNDMERQKDYSLFFKKNKVTKNKYYYKFLNFKSAINHFEINTFIEKYGINSLKNRKKIENSTIIDCGAYIGDSAYLFNKELNPKKIIALEPDSINYKILIKNISLNNLGNVIPIKIGVGEKRKDAYMNLRATIGAYLTEKRISRITDDQEKIKIISIDELVKENDLKNIGLIKMDIEGYELPAIKGAKEIIQRYRPVLLICLYHKGQDFFRIPTLIKQWVPNYRFKFVNIRKDHPVFERILIGEI